MDKLVEDHIEHIKRSAGSMSNVTIMEICGGHTNVIMKYGIRDVLPNNIKLISGPGCPVCVSSQHDIDCMIALAKAKIPVATYGDMLRVPGSTDSLDDIRAKGGQIFEVYSATEVLKLADDQPGIVFFGVGFETTAPMSAFLLSKGIPVYSVHKLVPPALRLLLLGDVKIDGFIDPGHVSTIIGVKPYRKIKVPQVVAGFTAERILRALRFLLPLISENKTITVNAYPEAVTENGNIQAQELLDKVFVVADSEWRGLGNMPRSGLEVRDDKLNAKKIYAKIIDKVTEPKKTACRCGEILKGLIEPVDCPLYGESCTPDSPQGACMVSDEGSCAIYFRYGK